MFIAQEGKEKNWSDMLPIQTRFRNFDADTAAFSNKQS